MSSALSKFGDIWVRSWRKVYHPLGFKHGYNFPMFIFCCGALMGLSLSRFEFFNVDGIFLHSLVPADSIKYQRPGYQRVSIILHLVGCLPAAFLVCFQFVPVIRYKAILFHRINGYIVLLLLAIGVIGGLILTPTTAGGFISTQLVLGISAALVFVSAALAIYYIKRLRIDLHREWMIRTWVYASNIITMRVLIQAMFRVIRDQPDRGWYAPISCESIAEQYAHFGDPSQPNITQSLYPACAVDPQATVAVNAAGPGPESATATIYICFGASMWLALALHVFAVEVYFRFTQDESERLRKLSAERRMQAAARAQPEEHGASSSDLGIDELKQPPMAVKPSISSSSSTS